MKPFQGIKSGLIVQPSWLRFSPPQTRALISDGPIVKKNGLDIEKIKDMLERMPDIQAVH